MYRLAATAILAGVIVFAVATGSAQQSSSAGPYKVLKTARVGGEGDWDYIYADAAGRRLYIPRRGGAPSSGNRRSPRTRARSDATDDLQSRHARAGGRDSRRRRKWHGRRSEIGPRVHQQQTQFRCSIPRR